MTLTNEVRVALLTVLVVSTASCGEPGGRGVYRLESGLAPAPASRSDPVGVLPSQVVRGEVGAFRAGGGGPPKDMGAADSLPSLVAQGAGAPRASGAQSGAAATYGTPPVGTPTP